MSQKEAKARIKNEISIIRSNIQLIKIYEQKIKDRIGEVCGE